MDRRPAKPAQAIISQFAGDPDMADLVDLFVGELPERIKALESAWGERRAEVVTRLAHQLKGSGAGYGFPMIGDAAAALEARVRGKGEEEAGAALESAVGEFRKLVDLCRRACRPS